MLFTLGSSNALLNYVYAEDLMSMLLRKSLIFCKKKENCHSNTALINCKANTRGVGNATYSPIGCWCGNRMTKNFCLS